MNKKGFTNFLIWIFLLVICTIGILFQVQPDIDTESIKGNLTWTEMDVPENSSIIIDVALRYINFMVYSSFEVLKVGIDYASEHPEVPWKLMMYGIVLAILFPIIVGIIKLFILIFLFVREGIQTSRDRRKLKRLKEQNG